MSKPMVAADVPHHRKFNDDVPLAVAQNREQAVVLLDGTGHVAGWNRGAEELLAYPASAALRKPFDIFFTPEDVTAAVPARELWTAAQCGESRGERWYQRGDGASASIR